MGDGSCTVNSRLRHRREWRGVENQFRSVGRPCSCILLYPTGQVRDNGGTSATLHPELLLAGNLPRNSGHQELFRRCGLARVVAPPAGHGIGGTHAAGVRPADTNGGEWPCRRRGLTILVPTPAGHGAVAVHTAGIKPDRADGGKRSCRRIRLAVPIAAPAGHRAIGAHTAGVIPAGADGGKRSCRQFAWPSQLLPQQVTVPLECTPQV